MKVKQKLIRYLSQYELFFKVKYSKIYYYLVRKHDQKLKLRQEKEYQLYKVVLSEMPSGSLIFDIGANIGDNTNIFLALGGSVIAVEPDLRNLHCLRARYSKISKVKIIPKVVSNNCKQETLFIQDDGSTLHTLSTKWKNYLESSANDRWHEPKKFTKKILIPSTTLDKLISKFGRPFFIKIDVEGYEHQVIKGLNQTIPLVSFEANLPQFLEETLACITYLYRLQKNATFNYSAGDQLLSNRFISHKEIREIVSSTTLRYLDIFCRM